VRIEINNDINFGLRKFASLSDIADKTKTVNVSSKEIKEFTQYMKQCRQKAKFHEAQAIKSASKVILNA